MKFNQKAQNVVEYLLIVAAAVAGVLGIAGPMGPMRNAVDKSINQAVETIYQDFAWKIRVSSSCTATCGLGTLTRDVWCKDEMNRVVPDANCANKGEKPANTIECDAGDCGTYGWVGSGFGLCNKECGGGTKTQAWVECRDSGGRKVDDHFCSGVKPVSDSCNMQLCYSWVASNSCVGPCDQSCGSGHCDQGVTCINNLTGTPTEDSNCPAGTRLPQRISCDTSLTCNYQWITENWSRCSKDCEDGIPPLGEKTRVVKCIRISDQHEMDSSATGPCGALAKPITSTPCNLGSCNHWDMPGGWGECNKPCGGGYQEADVHCLNQSNVEVDARLCDAGNKPSSTRGCNPGACLWGYDGYPACPTTCGAGVRTRNVWCYQEGFAGTKVTASFCGGTPEGDPGTVVCATQTDCTQNKDCTDTTTCCGNGTCESSIPGTSYKEVCGMCSNDCGECVCSSDGPVSTTNACAGSTTNLSSPVPPWSYVETGGCSGSKCQAECKPNYHLNGSRSGCDVNTCGSYSITYSVECPGFSTNVPSPGKAVSLVDVCRGPCEVHCDNAHYKSGDTCVPYACAGSQPSHSHACEGTTIGLPGPTSWSLGDCSGKCQAKCDDEYYNKSGNCTLYTYDAGYPDCPTACGQREADLPASSCTRSDGLSIAVPTPYCPGTKHCNATGTCYTGTWRPGTCNTTCGDGKISEPTCSGGPCDPDPAKKPSFGGSCQDISECRYFPIYPPFCPSACGQPSSNLSAIRCLRSDGTYIPVPTPYCPGTKHCNATRACYTGTWRPGTCSTTCGDGKISEPICSGGPCDPDPKKKPSFGQSCSNMSGCTYTAGYPNCPTACGQPASNLPASSCLRSDGTYIPVPTPYCPGTNPCPQTPPCQCRIDAGTARWGERGACVSDATVTCNSGSTCRVDDNNGNIQGYANYPCENGVPGSPNGDCYCMPRTIAHGSPGTPPDCTISCESGYEPQNGACVARVCQGLPCDNCAGAYALGSSCGNYPDCQCHCPAGQEVKFVHGLRGCGPIIIYGTWTVGACSKTCGGGVTAEPRCSGGNMGICDPNSKTKPTPGEPCNTQACPSGYGCYQCPNGYNKGSQFTFPGGSRGPATCKPYMGLTGCVRVRPSDSWTCGGSSPYCGNTTYEYDIDNPGYWKFQ